MGAKRSQVYDNLAHLLAAGVPIVRAVRTAGEGLRGKVARAMVEIARDMENGSTMAEAMKARPMVFPSFDVAVVEVACNSGSLPEGLRMLAKWYELMARVRRTMISGMVWPIVMLNIAAFAFPIPQLALYGLTLGGYIWEVAAILMFFYLPIATSILTIRFSGGGTMRRKIDAIALRVPVLGTALVNMALSRYCLAFGMMSRAGVSAATAARDAAELTGNGLIGWRLAGGAIAARDGNPVSEGFSPKLPSDFIGMWRVGEETGDIDAVIARMAAKYEKNAEQKFSELARWLPKLFYAAVCLMIIWILFMLRGIIIVFLMNMVRM